MGRSAKRPAGRFPRTEGARRRAARRGLQRFLPPAAGGTCRDRDGRQRAKAVPVEEIKAHVLAQKGTFLLADVINGAGGSQATVRKALDELIDAGKVEKLGPVPDYKGRGRAPLQYKRT